MAKVMVVYESKHGNTKLVAETIISGIKETPEMEAVISTIKKADPNRVAESDAILIGSPNHIGRPTRRTRKFISSLSEANLAGKLAAVFDTYIGKDFEKAVKKMEKQIGEDVPGLELVAPGLSIKVDGMKGPVSEGELPKCKEFGEKIANQISGNNTQ
ncbi:flavodoxin family protein [Candidatus Poribacteria bacterium]